MLSRLPLLIALTLLPLTACGSTDDDQRPTVMASFYPLQFVADRVVGEHARVSNLTAPGVEPHDLELSPRQVAALSDSDIVLYASELQPTVDQAIENSGPRTALDVWSVIELHAEGDADHADEDPDHAEEHAEEHAEGDADHADEHAEGDADHADDHDGHDHDGDPHFWLDPTLLAQVADEFTRLMATADPDHAEDYEANNAILQGDLTDLDEEFREGLEQCRTRTLVVSHDAFGYLGERYDLTVHAIAGLSPDAEPSPKHLGELADLIRTDEITTVFSETLASPRLAETLADELGIRTAVLDPLEGLVSTNADDDYLSLMRANLAAIQEADSCL